MKLFDGCIGKFFGPNKIKDVTAVNRTTTRGHIVAKIEYEDGHKEEIPEKVLTSLVSEKPIDMTTLVNKRYEPIILEIMEILLEHELKVEHVSQCFQQVSLSLNTSLEGAANKLWGKKFQDLSLVDIDRALKDDRK